MDQSPDTNADIWKSDSVVQQWVAGLDEREQKRIAHWHLLAELLPFAASDTFTFLDLGAGTGAASRVLLELYPNSRAVLGEYSRPMIEGGTQLLESYEGRFRYVEFDMLLETWPTEIPHSLDAAVTSLCVHHLPDANKKKLFAGIYDHLAPGNHSPLVDGLDHLWSTARVA